MCSPDAPIGPAQEMRKVSRSLGFKAHRLAIGPRSNTAAMWPLKHARNVRAPIPVTKVQRDGASQFSYVPSVALEVNRMINANLIWLVAAGVLLVQQVSAAGSCLQHNRARNWRAVDESTIRYSDVTNKHYTVNFRGNCQIGRAHV